MYGNVKKGPSKPKTVESSTRLAGAEKPQLRTFVGSFRSRPSQTRNHPNRRKTYETTIQIFTLYIVHSCCKRCIILFITCFSVFQALTAVLSVVNHRPIISFAPGGHPFIALFAAHARIQSERTHTHTRTYICIHIFSASKETRK